MTRRARIPESLARGPFTLEDASRAGLQRWHLEGSAWRRVGPRTYIAVGQQESSRLLIEAASQRLPESAAFSGATAAWLHGLDLALCDPIEITVPRAVGVATRSGMKVRRAELQADDVVKRKGLPLTSMSRTVRDVCSNTTLTEAVAFCDMALHARLVTLTALKEVVSGHTGHRGIATLRAALDYAEPATESPMETRMRMRLVTAGLPRPEVQAVVLDREMRFVARLDLYYREQRLGIEYDGSTHRESLAEDNRRQNRLLEVGVRLLRFTASDIYNSPEMVVNLVRSALRNGE